MNKLPEFGRAYGPPTTYLYHGTRSVDAIMSDNAIIKPAFGDQHVSLTTCFNVALYWASLPRDEPENETSAILVFRRKDLLDAGYSLTLFDGTGEDEEHEIACGQINDLKSVLFARLDVSGVDFERMRL